MAPLSTESILDPLNATVDIISTDYQPQKVKHVRDQEETEETQHKNIIKSLQHNNFSPNSLDHDSQRGSSDSTSRLEETSVNGASLDTNSFPNPQNQRGEFESMEDTIRDKQQMDKQQGAEHEQPLEGQHEVTNAVGITETVMGEVVTHSIALTTNTLSMQSSQQQEQQQQQQGIISSRPKLKRPPLRPIDLGSVPKKSILKKETAYPFIEQPAKNPVFKSQWLQSTVNKLAVMGGPSTPTAYTAQSTSMFRKLVLQAAAATSPSPTSPSGSHRPAGPPIFTNNERSRYSLADTEGSSSSLLSDKALKHVRFSVGQLTTEHIFHHDDAYESAEETEPSKTQVQIITTPAPPKKLLTTTDGVVVDDNIYTAKEIMNYYLVACNTREESPIDRLINDMHAAASRPSNPLLTTIDLTGEPLPRKTLDPIADVLTLEFGLKQLYLDNCNLEDDTLKMLLYSLLLTDTLTVLSVQDNKKIKSNGFKYISVFVKKTKALKVLNVSGIAMDKRSIEFLAHALKVGRLGFGSRLEELRMDRCGLRGNLLEIMAPAIRESNLRNVSMRSNRIGSSGGVWIGVLIRDYDDQLNAAIPINNEEQGFKRVFPGISNPELLKRTRGVEVLDISDNDLRQGADYVAQTLRRNMSLKSLVMTHNNLDPARLAVLADALKLNIGLESLDLSHNRVCGPTVTGINALTQKLSYNKTLKKLTLSNTGLQSEGAIALAEFLPETRTLTQLDLTGNDLVDIAGVMALSVSIRMNNSLTCLDLNVPPNDAEFARLSRDILRACIRNMEEKTGSNAGMPSPDVMPSNTIFSQPSSPFISGLSTAADEDRRWQLLESVAGELYRTREALGAMEKALNHEKAMRRNWLEHFYRKNAVPLPNTLTGENGHVGDPHTSTPPLEPIPATPEEKKMLEVAKGVLYRAPPQIEMLYHQCKRHQANILNLNSRIDNDKALHELETMYNLLNVFLEAYLVLFALPEIPNHVVIRPRTNSLQPADSAEGPASSTNLAESSKKALVDSEIAHEKKTAQDQVVPQTLSEEPESDIDSSFLLEDEDDMDDEVYTNDALIDVRRTKLLSDHRSGQSSPPKLTSIDGQFDPERGTEDGDGDDEIVTKNYSSRGFKPTPVNTESVVRIEAEKSPSTLASPLEKLRKAVEEEEGEVLRRGKDLLENGLENGLEDETMSGEELKIQLLTSENHSP
ncbi:hypothetical protein BX616_008131 [Lobosporangium transversale]|nr:hypothetical protein BX616_008131 [Lobosporangium transversale]